MSNENVEPQTNSNENTETNPSTDASKNNVPYDRFQEVNQAKNDMASQVGKLQAQIDQMNQTGKDKKQSELVEQGKVKEALDIMTKERDTYKVGHDEWNGFKVDKRESLMKQLTNDDDKSIAEGLSDLIKLETYVNKVINVNPPSASQARATSGKVGEFGGFGSIEEYAMKDPLGFENHLKNNVKGYIK